MIENKDPHRTKKVGIFVFYGLGVSQEPDDVIEIKNKRWNF